MTDKQENFITETERLIIRVPTLDDAPDSFEIYGDAETMKFIDGSEPYESIEQTRESIKRGIAHYEKHGVCHWSTVEKATGKMIGHCGFNMFEETDKLELVMHINRSYWNKGYATEAGKAVILYALNELKADSIVALIEPENISSIKITENLGLSFVDKMFLDGYLLNYYELKNSGV